MGDTDHVSNSVNLRLNLFQFNFKGFVLCYVSPPSDGMTCYTERYRCCIKFCDILVRLKKRLNVTA